MLESVDLDKKQQQHRSNQRLIGRGANGDEKRSGGGLVDEANVSVAGAHALEPDGVVADERVLAEVVVHDLELDEGELRTVDHERERLVPERIEAIVAHGLRTLVGHVRRHAAHAHAHIRIADVFAAAFSVLAAAAVAARAWQSLAADETDVEAAFVAHRARLVRIEVEACVQQNARLEHVAARAVVAEHGRVQLHLRVHVLEVERRCHIKCHAY